MVWSSSRGRFPWTNGPRDVPSRRPKERVVGAHAALPILSLPPPPSRETLPRPPEGMAMVLPLSLSSVPDTPLVDPSTSNRLSHVLLPHPRLPPSSSLLPPLCTPGGRRMALEEEEKGLLYTATTRYTMLESVAMSAMEYGSGRDSVDHAEREWWSSVAGASGTSASPSSRGLADYPQGLPHPLVPSVVARSRGTTVAEVAGRPAGLTSCPSLSSSARVETYPPREAMDGPQSRGGKPLPIASATCPSALPVPPAFFSETRSDPTRHPGRQRTGSTPLGWPSASLTRLFPSAWPHACAERSPQDAIRVPAIRMAGHDEAAQGERMADSFLSWHPRRHVSTPPVVPASSVSSTLSASPSSPYYRRHAADAAAALDATTHAGRDRREEQKGGEKNWLAALYRGSDGNTSFSSSSSTTRVSSSAHTTPTTTTTTTRTSISSATPQRYAQGVSAHVTQGEVSFEKWREGTHVSYRSSGVTRTPTLSERRGRKGEAFSPHVVPLSRTITTPPYRLYHPHAWKEKEEETSGIALRQHKQLLSQLESASIELS